MIIALLESLNVYKLGIVYRTPGCVIVITTVVTGKMKTHPFVVRRVVLVSYTLKLFSTHKYHVDKVVTMVTLSQQVLHKHVANHNSDVIMVTASDQIGCVMVIMIVGITLMSKTAVCN